MSKLSALDLAFFALETAANPKHVAALAIFAAGKNDPRVNPGDILEEMRGVAAAPPFDQKLAFSLASMPRWVEDPDVDLDWHIRHLALPENADVDDLMLLVSQLHATVLDRTRPLWEFYLIEGLEDEQFAILIKIHHAYMDGGSMIKRITETLNTSAKDTTLMPIWGTKSERPTITPEESGMLKQLLGSLKGAGEVAKSIPMMGSLAVSQSLQVLGLKKGLMPVPFSAPRTRLNEPLTPARSAAIAKMKVARLKAVAKAAGVTVNDLLLALCDNALHAYLDKTGESLDKPLVAQMPISVRREDSGNAGNQITIALVEISSTSEDPVEHLKEINARTVDVKNHYGRMSEFTATSYTVLIQSLAQVADTVKANRLIPPLGNVLISNVRGPNKKLFLRGAELVGMYPISLLPPGVSANVTFLSIGDVVYIGVVAGREAISDAAFVAREMEKSLTRLSRLLTGKAATRKKN